MQLISTLLFLLSLLMLGGAILFLALWHRSYHKTALAQMVREGIGNIGISVIVEYPDTPAPLVALLEEEYPHCEAIIIIDLETNRTTFEELIPQFRLVGVNHSHLEGVRALYRSRHRAFRRVVMVDLPIEYRSHALDVAKKVAAFDYTLHLDGECQIARNAIAYCANIIASHPTTKGLILEAIVGANAQLERTDLAPHHETHTLLTTRALAWRNTTPLFLILAITLPAIAILFAHISGERTLILAALVLVIVFGPLLYISCRVVTDKGLYSTTNTIVKNFSLFMLEQLKKLLSPVFKALLP